jgi:hypothetical protein
MMLSLLLVLEVVQPRNALQVHTVEQDGELTRQAGRGA